MLPDLMQTGALCAVDQIFAEYHDADFDRVAGPAVKQQLPGRRMAPSPAREGKRRGGGGGGGGGSGGVAARLKRAANPYGQRVCLTPSQRFTAAKFREGL